MNVPDSWVKSVCEKLGIAEPEEQLGVFWDGDGKLNCNWYDNTIGVLTDQGVYGFQSDDSAYWEHFKAFSPETIAAIKKDLGIE